MHILTLQPLTRLLLVHKTRFNGKNKAVATCNHRAASSGSSGSGSPGPGTIYTGSNCETEVVGVVVECREDETKVNNVLNVTCLREYCYAAYS